MEVLNFNPFSIPNECSEAIGRIILASSQLEDIIQQAITGFAKLDFRAGYSLTLHMSNPTRLDALKALAKMTLSDDDLRELNDILGDVKQSQSKRNLYAHHSIAVKPDGAVVMIKLKARGTLKSELQKIVPSQIESDAKQIYDVSIKLYTFLSEKGYILPIPDA